MTSIKLSVQRVHATQVFPFHISPGPLWFGETAGVVVAAVGECFRPGVKQAAALIRLRPLALVLLAAFFAVRGAHANDLCTTAGASTTCSGDQSAGISLNAINGSTSLFVQSLTMPIGPTAGTSGINFQSLGANGVSAAPAGVAGSDLTTTTDTSVSISTTSGAPESW